MTIFTIIIIFISYELCYLGPTMILPSPWHLFMTQNYWIIFAGQCYISYHPYHPIAVFEECGHYGKYYPLGMSQTWCISGCRFYSQAYVMYIGAHCCSQEPLMSYGQHFIWSLEWIEWGKFRCKAARVLIFGPTILSCIKRDRVCYKGISPSGDL